MSIAEITKPSSVLAAIREFDDLERDVFLREYGFGEAREFFLIHEGKRYDSKAIVGAAYAHEFPDRPRLTSRDFSDGQRTVARKLRALGFRVEPEPGFLTSEQLELGHVYTRADLRERFGISDATINTGIFQPKGHDSIWLFVTEKKTPDRVQYDDLLDGDTLKWQGQPSGRKDNLIVTHEAEGLELLVFYRQSKSEFEHAGFIYEGPFRYVEHTPGKPSSFILRRMDNIDPVLEAEALIVGRPGQGFHSSQRVRKAIEDYAVAKAIEFLKPHWPLIRNVGATHPFDLHCFAEDRELRVEVKGTTNSGVSVLLTANEVTHARDNASNVSLFVCAEVAVEETAEAVHVSGGICTFLHPWDIGAGHLTPINFKYELPAPTP